MSNKLTNSEIQHINSFSMEAQLQILHICAENLGLISAEEYCEATGIKKRTFYDYLAQGKIVSFEISGKKLPLINLINGKSNL